MNRDLELELLTRVETQKKELEDLRLAMIERCTIIKDDFMKAGAFHFAERMNKLIDEFKRDTTK